MSAFDRRRPSVESTEPERNGKPAKYFRLQVFWDPDYGLTEICEEQVTSNNPTAVRVEGGFRESLQLISDEVRWLHEQLGDLVRALDEARAKAEQNGEVEP